MAAPTQTRQLDAATIGDHFARLYRVALGYCGSRERAEDLVQDTYVRVLSKPRFLRNGDDLGYLLRVLRNVFISQYRRDSSRPALATAEELDRFEDGSARQPHEIAEGRLVYKAIAELPPNFRDAIVAVSVAGGLLVHGQVTGGRASGSDWDSATPGTQTVPADGTFGVDINGGDGNDSITVLAKKTEITGVKLDGGAGDDVLTGADSNDSLSGGDGNDRLIGAGGADTMSGGAGNDTLVWNNGDGSDTMDGDEGHDDVDVNGAPAPGDVFTILPTGDRIEFHRSNCGRFTLDASAERFQVNGLGGDDSLTSQDGVGALTLLSVDGGAGNDTITGSDGPDLIVGG